MGVPWARFGRSWALLGRSWVLLGALGALLERSWSALERSWNALGQKYAKKPSVPTFLRPNLEPQIHTSWLKNPLKIDVKKNIGFKAMFSRLFRIFHRFPIRSKNVDFVKNSVFPKENYDF